MRLLRASLVSALAVAGSWLLDQNALRSVEQQAEALRETVASRLRNDASRVPRIVLVTLDEATFQRLGGPPVSRAHHTRVIQELRRAGARAIGFDLIFTAPSPFDHELAQAVLEKNDVVFGCASTSRNPDPELAPAFRAAGFPIAHLEVEGSPGSAVIDHVAGGITGRSGTLKPFSSALAERVERARSGASSNLESRFVRFRGGEVPFPSVPYEHVVDGCVDDPFYRESGFFRGCVALIGDISESGGDVVETHVGTMPGVVFHAHALATRLARVESRDLPWGAALGMVTSLTSLVFLASWRLRPGRMVAFCATTGATLVGVNVFLYAAWALRMPLAWPLTALAISTLGLLMERGQAEEFERRRLRALLRRHLSPQIAEHIIAHPDASITGKVTATVLFSDIRGFTTLSEQQSPEFVMSLLNEYLQEMTDLVFRYDGAVDKYIGDAIMALYGAPMCQPDHALRAVGTAIEMEAALLRLRERWQGQGMPAIDIGIGINTGEMVVGYMGSRDRMDFSAIGDAVNTASRVEGLNKELGTRILITAATYAQVSQAIEVRSPHQVKAKGKQEPLMLYEVVGWREGVAPTFDDAEKAPVQGDEIEKTPRSKRPTL